VSSRGLPALAFATLVLAAASRASAQFSGFGAFDTVHAGSMSTNDRTGDFSIPGRFSATRQGTEIDGDRALGNAGTKQVEVDGNVVVHFSKPLVVVGAGPAAASGPSTLTCDQLQIDGAHQVYHAIGNVHYTAAGRETTSDRAELDGATNQLHLEGRIAISTTGGQGGVGGFDTIKAATIDSDATTGDFTIPGHFTATREGLEIAGDHAKGNSVTKQISVTGNVVVTMQAGNAIKPPSPAPSPQISTLTCDRLDIDGVRHVYHAIGNVHYHEPTRDITADRADMTEANTHIHLEGNVHVTDNGQSGAS
jgi:lipopolysaccharide assembly outer membrane protein LptD (OstA)